MYNVEHVLWTLVLVPSLCCFLEPVDVDSPYEDPSEGVYIRVEHGIIDST